MSNYRRAREGNTYFFTLVTYQRQPILCLDQCRPTLREVIKEVQFEHPFEIKAWVLLPDHLHCIWELPEGDFNYSMRWGLIKKEFTKRISSRVGYAHQIIKSQMVGAAHPTESRKKHREGTVWQRRFWEHQIRNERDFAVHCDYIHYNPVKHGLVKSPKDWLHSTFHRYVKEGAYPMEWGTSEIDFLEEIGGE